MDTLKDHSRRQFLKRLAILTAAIPFSRLLSSPLNAYAKTEKAVPLPSGQTAVSESDPVASAIGYHQHIKDIDYVKYPQRKKPEAKNQFCKTCALFTPVNDGWGKCQMLTAGLVSAEGWCGSWSKKS